MANGTLTTTYVRTPDSWLSKEHALYQDGGVSKAIRAIGFDRTTKWYKQPLYWILSFLSLLTSSYVAVTSKEAPDITLFINSHSFQKFFPSKKIDIIGRAIIQQSTFLLAEAKQQIHALSVDS